MNIERPFIFALFLLAAFTAAVPSIAEESKPAVIKESAIPAEGAKIDDFIPPGWGLEAKVENDLNGDKNPDAVLVLIETPPQSTETKADSIGNRTLLILTKSATDGYRRLALAKHLLRCKTCYGTMAGSDGGAPEIKIVNGVLTVQDLWGSRETVNARLSFRYDQRVKRMALIGEDVETTDRLTGITIRTSSNFLTGIKLTESDYPNQKRKQKAKKQRIPKIKRFIDDIDYEKY
jgi:hypothetical protein